MQAGVRVSLRLVGHLGPLSSLRSHQTGHPIAEEDFAPLDNVVSSVAGLAWSQRSCSATCFTDARLRLVIESLELSVPGSRGWAAPPTTPPFLFGGKFGETCFSELEGRIQAAQFRPRASRPASLPFPKASPVRWSSSGQEVAGRLSPPRPPFPLWSSRGGAPRGRDRGTLRGGPS